MFEIEFTAKAVGDLERYRKVDQKIILDRIEAHLQDSPLVETRNRKPLRSNVVSQWELRMARFRVFYDVDVSERRVTIRAIGHKEHNTLFIGGQEFEL